MNVTVHRLANGLTVYISPMPEETSVRAWTVVRSGSRNDPADATGLAHYLEHMNFKGTGKIASGDYARERPHLDAIAALYAKLRTAPEAERAGILAQIDAENQESAKLSNSGELTRLYDQLGVHGYDAFTWTDVTAYTHVVPQNRVGAWARVEAERYREPAFREFYSELESVYEERNMRDIPDRRVWDEMFLGLFPGHPYGTQTTIGTVEHLKTPRFAEMVKYFHDWYAPNNMAIVLVGAVDPATTIAQLDEAFADWTPRTLPEPPPGRIEPLSGRVERRVLDAGPETVTLAWQLPRGGYDAAAWDAIDDLLGGTGGLLQTQLVMKQKLGWARTSLVEMKDASLYMIQAGLADGQSHAQAESLLLDVVHRVAEGDVAPELVKAAELNCHLTEERSMESAEWRTSWLQETFTGGREWADQVARLARVEQLSKAEVVAEAARHFGKGYVAVYRAHGEYVPPKVQKPKITPIRVDHQEMGEFARSILALPVAPIEPHFLERDHDFERGALVTGPIIAAHNPAGDLYEVTYVFEGGAATDPKLCWALDHLDLAGTRDLSAVQVREKLYALGTTVTGGCERDLHYLKVAGVDRDLDAASSFVRDWLGAPVFSPDGIEREVANALRQRRDSLDDKTQRQTAAQLYLQYGKDSSYLRGVLANTELLRLSSAALTRAVTGLGRIEHTTLYFGPRPLAQLGDAVRFGSARQRGVAAPPLRLVRSQRPEILFVPFVSADARVYLSIPVGHLRGGDRGLARLFTIFAHRYSWEEIREARGLAYSVGTRYALEGRSADEGGVLVSVASQADKLAETLPFLLTLLADFKPTAARLDAAKGTRDAVYRADRIAPRDVPRAVYDWSRLGLDADPRPVEWQATQAATLDSLTAFSRQVTKASPYRMVVIGDPARVDQAMLRKIAPVREIAPEALFGYGPFPAAKP